MTEIHYEKNDEIDLLELFATLWYHKFWIVVITSLFIFYSAYYVINTNKQYTATAIFEIEQNNSTGFNIPSEFGALASVAGFEAAGGSNIDILMERMMEREFILKVSQTLFLKNDPLFQTYNPNAVDPTWKAIIKKLIRWEQHTQDEKYIVENQIQKNYLKYVETSKSPGGAIEIAVTHNDPNLAAQYANQIMELVRKTVTTEEEETKEVRLAYLAETLADALQDMEVAQQNIKNYTLQNSAAAQDNFIVGSLQLDSMRLERREAKGVSACIKQPSRFS